MRKFEICSKWANRGINLPARKTKNSAGYDIEAAEDTVIPAHKMVIVPTGLKAQMNDNEYLQLVVRSGISIGNLITLINANGIIDADYYNNEDNEGHLMVPLINHGNTDYMIAKGQRIAQGIFMPYLTTDDDEKTEKATRKGGSGSTGK